ncbi:hypothetical protein FQZ97_1181650 [compost metagenome]
MCESMSPGITVRPPASTVRVIGPESARTCAALPTATMRPSRTASACAVVAAASSVAIFALVTIRSADWACVAGGSSSSAAVAAAVSSVRSMVSRP